MEETGRWDKGKMRDFLREQLPPSPSFPSTTWERGEGKLLRWFSIPCTNRIVKYDDASWHYGGDFPVDMPYKAGATHIGMFLAWCISNGLADAEFLDNCAKDFGRLQRREVTPGQFLIEICDGKLINTNLSTQGNAFAKSYYTDGPYFTDYETILGQDFDSLYRVADTWENYDLLAPVIRRRFDRWQAFVQTRGQAS